MRAAMAGLIGAVIVFPTAAAPAPALTVPQILDLCAASSMAEASTRGDALGWRRADEARLKQWRDSFTAHNGGTVEVLGWRRGQREEDDTLSFWIARGPNGRRACYYSVAEAAHLLDSLSERLGPPSSVDDHDGFGSAFWTSGPSEIQLTRVGSMGLVNISRRD